MTKIKLLVVDDSILFREVLARHIHADESIQIVGKAGDAYAARDLILKFEPDVMTLDLEMPKMDGVAFLQKLLPQYYIPTIVVSSSAERRNACREAGAVEFLEKPITRTNEDMAKFAADLCASIKRAYSKRRPAAPASAAAPASPMTSAVMANGRPAPDISAASSLVTPRHPSPMSSAADAPREPKPNVSHPKLKKSEGLIALGASTGGTEALEKVVREFPADTPPVLIVQHMPAGFTKLYADRLNSKCKMEVKEAEDGDRLRRGLIILGAGEHHLRLCKDQRGWYVSSKPGEKVSGHCPSVDVMFTSVAENAGALAVGAILTGMGRDGADGMLKMHNAGCYTIGQDKETCVVYGMPMEAYKLGAVSVQAPLYNIADMILDCFY